jgi:hypothetical protein
MSSATPRPCPDCEHLDRRAFLGVTAVSVAGFAVPRQPAWADVPSAKGVSETAVAAFYETLTDKQKQAICFDWGHTDKERGLLRTHVSNNWQITRPHIASEFFTKKQKNLLHDAFKGLFSPEWYPKILQQLKDDTGGKVWGAEQSVALFGVPGQGKFELVMTGRHMTIRIDGNSEDHVALGGPIFHGHAPIFNEKKDHPGNVFWHQALEANKVFGLLDSKQQKQALVYGRPHEAEVPLQGREGTFDGLPVKELSGDQKSEVKKVLELLLAPYRQEDRDEVMACLQKQGGLDACNLMFYSDGDIGNDRVWDNWRLEGPSFVWYFRGEPHVHIWINVADSPEVKLNSKG